MLLETTWRTIIQPGPRCQTLPTCHTCHRWGETNLEQPTLWHWTIHAAHPAHSASFTHLCVDRVPCEAQRCIHCFRLCQQTAAQLPPCACSSGHARASVHRAGLINRVLSGCCLDSAAVPKPCRCIVVIPREGWAREGTDARGIRCCAVVYVPGLLATTIAQCLQRSEQLACDSQHQTTHHRVEEHVGCMERERVQSYAQPWSG